MSMDFIDKVFFSIWIIIISSFASLLLYINKSPYFIFGLLISIILSINILRIYLNKREKDNETLDMKREKNKKEVIYLLDFIDFENEKIENIYNKLLGIFILYPHSETRKLLWKYFKRCCDRDRIIMEEL